MLELGLCELEGLADIEGDGVALGLCDKLDDIDLLMLGEIDGLSELLMLLDPELDGDCELLKLLDSELEGDTELEGDCEGL